MAIDTKPNLNSEKFEQFSGDTLNLSGITRIYGNIEYAGNAPLNSTNKSLVHRDYLLTGDTSLFNRDLNATTNGLYAFKSNTTFKGQGQVILTNGSAILSGTSTAFLNATEPTGVNFWRSIYVKDSANNWYRVNIGTPTTNTSAPITGVHSRSMIRSGTFNSSGNVNVPLPASTYTGVTGTYDYYLGYMNWSDGRFSVAMGNGSYAENYSVAMGGATVAVGSSSFATGFGALSAGVSSIAMGSQSRAMGNYSVAMGYRSQATGLYSIAFGINAFAQGESSVVIGRGWDVAGSASDRPVIASGLYSINISRNDASQTSGHGALADYSGIIGGLNNNIPSNSTYSLIIGGNTVKALSADTNTVYMPKVRIGWGTGGALTSGSTSNDVIVRGTGGLLQTRTISSITSGLTANNGINRIGNNFRLGGTLTGNTTIDGGNFALNLGRNSSKLSIISATTTNQQYFTSNVLTADPLNAAFQFIDDTNTDSAGRFVTSFEKRWSGGGAPDGNNTGYINFILPNNALTRRNAVDFRWSMSPTANNETSFFAYRGLYTGSTVNLMTVGGNIGIGTGSQVIGTGDIAIGLETRAWNAAQIAIGYRAGKTSGAATGRSNAISIGINANQGTYSIGANSIAIGTNAVAKSGNTYSIGQNAGNTSGSGGDNAVSIGTNANQGTSNIGANSIAIGTSTKAVGDGSIAIGSSVQLVGSGSNIAIGASALAGGGSGVAIGVSAQANSGAESTAIGGSSRANTTSTTVVGFSAGNSSGSVGSRHGSYGAYANQGTHTIGTDSIGIGTFSKSIGIQSLAIGYFARSGGVQVVSIGDNAGNTTGTTNQYAINIGYRAGKGSGNPVIGQNSISIGSDTVSTAQNSITIGNNITNSTQQSFQIGWNNNDDFKLVKGTLQTTNDTQGTLLSYTLTTGSTYSIKATVKARTTGGTDHALYVKQGLFYRQGGGATQQGTTQDVITDIESNASWDATLDVNGNDVRVRVTGVAATTINWHVILEIQRIS